jgi:hypothetical protein
MWALLYYRGCEYIYYTHPFPVKRQRKAATVATMVDQLQNYDAGETIYFA